MGWKLLGMGERRCYVEREKGCILLRLGKGHAFTVPEYG
jgi:hypothetical protein